MKNFKGCKEIFIKYTNGTISQKEFDDWSKTYCENCWLFVGKKNDRHCIFGKK